MSREAPPSSEVLFRGPGPFYLPAAQSATAEAGSDAITVSFRVLVNPSQVEVVRIPIVKRQALALAEAIKQAASG
jgi:hypothetical protein